MRIRLFVIGSLVAAAAGCGGGGGGGAVDGGSGSTTYTVAGTITAGADSAIDGDTADASVPRISNSSLATAQRLRNPVSVGGYANEATDEFDVYRVDLAGGQQLNLFVAEDGEANDLDLLIGDLGGNVLASSLGTGKLETIVVPGSGAASYFVQVSAFAGSSNYVLSITQQGQTAAAQPSNAMSTQAEFLPDQALVAYRDDAGAAEAKALGTQSLGHIPGRVDLLDLSNNTKALETLRSGDFHYSDPVLEAKARTLLAIKAMQAQPGVKFAEPNLLRHASALPNDEFVSQQWHYNLINLPQAWDLTHGSASVIVAVADTGVRLGHPDLVGKFDPADLDGFDFVNDPRRSLDGNGRDGNADDPGDGGVVGGSSFHGTHVAGTIAAATNNGIGVAGAGWDTRIMPLRVLGEGGSGSAFDITNAVLYAARLPNASSLLAPVKASVINLSLGSENSSATEQQAYADAIAAGVIVVAAAGNSGDSRMSYPASYPGVVSVAAVGRQKQRAPYSQFNSAVDVAAPGGDQSRAGADGVLSTLSGDGSGPIRDGLGYLQGTSMATPHVAGVVALMKAVNPNLTPAQFDALLASGAITEDLGAAGRDNSFGYGLIDANKAVREAIRLANGTPPPDNPRLGVQPDSLTFGSALTQATLDARNAGTGDLTITAISDDAPWLTVSAQSVNASGQGRYLATVDRSGLASGTYSATITFVSPVNTVTVPVLMTIGTVVGTVDAGKQYVLLVDPDRLDAVDTDEVVASGGQYRFTLSAPDGDYLLISGTDSDDDGFVCDDGEACGGFPTLDTILPVTIGGAARTGLDFLVSFDLSAPDTQAVTSPLRRGYRVRD
jgi:serine protease